jgi:hypothetical protein
VVTDPDISTTTPASDDKAFETSLADKTRKPRSRLPGE